MSTPSLRERISALHGNPWFTLTMTALAIAGGLFAIYTWLDSKASRELKYFVNPARAVVVEKGRSSGLEVTFHGEKIDSDISAVQIAVWNEGKTPIKRADVLKPVEIRVAGEATILEATIRNPGREVSLLTLDQTDLKLGIVRLGWSILERGDGGVIQIIYSGTVGSVVSVDGVIEGQKKPEALVVGPNRKPVGLGGKIVTLIALFGFAGWGVRLIFKVWTESINLLPRTLAVVTFVLIIGFLCWTFSDTLLADYPPPFLFD